MRYHGSRGASTFRILPPVKSTVAGAGADAAGRGGGRGARAAQRRGHRAPRRLGAGHCDRAPYITQVTVNDRLKSP